jgi:Domain of unknown function (DUF4157)
MNKEMTVRGGQEARFPLAGFLQRKCDCGTHTGGGECDACKKKEKEKGLQRHAAGPSPAKAPPIVHEVLKSPGQPLDGATRDFMEPRFGHDFSQVRVHTDTTAAESARAVRADAYTVGQQIIFAARKYSPGTAEGRELLAHELTHSRQQASGAEAAAGGDIHVSDDPASEQSADATAKAVVSGRSIQGELSPRATNLYRRPSPYIKKVTVHLAPSQSADLLWEGSAPNDAPGSDHFKVSTGKGYSDPGDPAGTCERTCCSDPDTQCAPPWNQPGHVGACCTYFGSDFWTGTPLTEHNSWKWWTPIQPYYSSRGIALHQHDEVSGQPIGHGCVRMEEPNAKRIHDFSNGRKTNVTIDGRAAPVKCDDSRKCNQTPSKQSGTGASGKVELPPSKNGVASRDAVPGLEGAMS